MGCLRLVVIVFLLKIGDVERCMDSVRIADISHCRRVFVGFFLITDTPLSFSSLLNQKSYCRTASRLFSPLVPQLLCFMGDNRRV